MAWFDEPARGQVYAVYDAARSPEILPALRASGQPHECLLEERVRGAVREAAPYVVAVDPARSLGRRTLVEGWAARWAIFLRAPVHLQAVRDQLRRSIIARDPSGRRLIFRFYDPRVLRTFLPTCLPPELEQIFGPIEAMYALRDEQNMVDVYTRAEDGSLAVEQRSGPAELDEPG